MTTMTVNIKCGNCKGSHGTVAEVRACHGFEYNVSTPAPHPGVANDAPATPKQVDFIARLRAERNLPSTPSVGLASLTKKQASSVIEQLLAMPKPEPVKTTSPATPSQAVEGMHKIGDEIFKVQKAVHGSGHLYAKRLVPGEGYGSKARFEYAPGVLKTLSAATLMSLEEAKAWGALYGTCCVCGRTLTNEESIDAGIGPICAKKF